MKTSFWIFYLLDFAICTVLCFSFVRYYASKKISRFMLNLYRLFLFANYLLIFTLPYEIVYYNLRKDAKDEYEENFNFTSIFYQYNSNESNFTERNITNKDIEDLNKLLKINYGIIFWVLVTFSNQIIYFFIYFEESGEFTFWRKLWDAFKSNLIRTIITSTLISILTKYLTIILAFFIIFALVPIGYAIAFLAISIVKFPRIMYIHSNEKLALEYYEFKANKKLKELNKNDEELKKIYFRCQNTFDYIKNIEDFLNKKNKDESNKNILFNDKIEIKKENNNDNFNIEKKEKKDEVNELKERNELLIEENDKKEENDKIYEEKEKKEGDNDIIDDKKEEKNKIDEETEKKEEENDKIYEEKEKKKKEKEKKKIEKDYKKHKSFLKFKKYIYLLNANVTKIMAKNNIDMGDKLDEKPIKEYKDIIKLNAKSKLLDVDNERINAQIKGIYNNWAFLKEITIKYKKSNNIQNEIQLNPSENKDINASLTEDGYIPSIKISEKKIKFFQKYNKRIYISLMIIFIILDILIVLSEITLILPVNISIFGHIFKSIKGPVFIHIFCILVSTLFFVYACYSFGKIKTMGRNYLIFGNNQTNSLGLLTYSQKLSTITFPISLNIITMIFHEIGDKDIKPSLRENYGNEVGDTIFNIVEKYIPSFLIIAIIIYYFDIWKRICKKKKKTSFYLRNELREKHIEEGREYLMRLNKIDSSNSEIII